MPFAVFQPGMMKDDSHIMSNIDNEQSPKTSSSDNVDPAALIQDVVEEERRTTEDRRSKLDRRRGPGRRRTDYRRAAEEGHMNEEQLDFIRAIDEYKRVNHRPFPTWTEVLDIVLFLGYRRVAPEGEFKLFKGRQTPRRDGGGSE
ncbi:MAG: hypothetical protein ABIG44_06370 [Planctomycetota bacterium]